MSSFKDMIESDNTKVFMNAEEFAERHKIAYDGHLYQDVSIVLTKLKEKDRRQLANDHAQGLYLASVVMHCALSDLNGVLPEKGTKIKISDGGFMREYYVTTSGCELGMIRLELEVIDE